MFSSETKIRVRYAETDQMGTVYHSNYFYYFEAARAEAIRDLGFTYAEMEEMGILMPVVDLQASFQRPAFYDDLLTIKTFLKELLSDHKIEFHHEVFNEKKKLLCTGKISFFFLEKGTRKKISIPDHLKKNLEHYFQ